MPGTSLRALARCPPNRHGTDPNQAPPDCSCPICHPEPGRGVHHCWGLAVERVVEVPSGAGRRESSDLEGCR
jgi:hypothetical protein